MKIDINQPVVEAIVYTLANRTQRESYSQTEMYKYLEKFCLKVLIDLSKY